MRRSRSVLVVVVLGLAGALAIPGGVSALPARKECSATAIVTNTLSGSVSTIGVKTRTKHPTDIPVGSSPVALAVTPDGKTVFVPNFFSGTVSTVDVKTRTKNPDDIAVSDLPWQLAFTPCHR